MEFVRETPFEFGYTVWPVRPPQWSFAPVIKATFAIVAGGVCTIADEQAPCSGETHFDDDPARSLQFDTDLAIMKLRGECFVAGQCHPPGGAAVRSSIVAFEIGSVRKSLAVFGDRHWSRGVMKLGMSDPAPFTSMPLAYERSFGGPGFDKNPVGRGIVALESEGGRVPLPNIEDPHRLIADPADRPEPAGAFPRSSTWRDRMARTGTYDAAWRAHRWPWYPDDFDYGYFNSAPRDQQIAEFWRGDEAIVLRNLHPQHALIETRLPALRPRVFLATGGVARDALREVEMRLDTISVDAEKLLVFCVWRGLTDVATERLEEIRHVFFLHEEIYARHGADAYRARYEQKLAEGAASEQAFEAEDVPTEPGNVGAKPAATGGVEDPFNVATAPAIEPSENPFDVPTEQVNAAVPGPAWFGSNAGSTASAALARAGLPDATPAVMPERQPIGPTSADLARLREEVQLRHARGESLEGMDLTAVDLSDLVLNGANFTQALLVGATLRNASLHAAVFDGADLTGADLSTASLERASLRATDLTRARGDRANFTGAQLGDATLIGTAMPDSTFRSATCTRCDFSGAHLEGANFVEADLTEADLSGAFVDGADFQRAVLAEAWMYGLAANHARFDEANLTKARASDGARFVESTFRYAQCAGALLDGARLDGASLAFAQCERADFTGASLVKAHVDGCNLKHAKFARAILVGATILKSDLFEANFESADLSHVDARGSNFFGSQFWRANTTMTKFDSANLERTLLA